jgi:hypothetical protein
MSQNRNAQNFALSNDQRLLLDLYIDFYNHTIRQINSLYELQNEIRGNINHIVGLSAMHDAPNLGQSSNNYRNNFRYNNVRNVNDQRRRRNNLDSNNRRYMHYGNIPYLVQVDNFMTGLDGRARGVFRHTRENINDNIFNNILRTFYDRIQVAPTRQQIEAATRVISFSEIENPLNISCPVTLDRFENNSSVTQIIPCGHIFSPSGIESWLQTNVRCPVCRCDIREYTPTTNNVSEQNNEEIRDNARDNARDETNDEAILEEPANVDEQPQERNSIPNSNPTSVNTNSNNIHNVLASLTDNILGHLLNPNSSNLSGNPPIRNFVFDNSFNSFTYDSSNNIFTFESTFR